MIKNYDLVSIASKNGPDETREAFRLAAMNATSRTCKTREHFRIQLSRSWGTAPAYAPVCYCQRIRNVYLSVLLRRGILGYLRRPRVMDYGDHIVFLLFNTRFKLYRVSLVACFTPYCVWRVHFYELSCLRSLHFCHLLLEGARNPRSCYCFSIPHTSWAVQRSGQST